MLGRSGIRSARTRRARTARAASARRVAHPSLYAARLIDDHGTPALLGFRDTGDGTFIGEIPDPIPVALDDGTSLRYRSRPDPVSF